MDKLPTAEWPNFTPPRWTNFAPPLTGKAVRRAIRAAGAKLLFLPPYSPDLNPIEQVFSKLKTLMRKAAERTVEDTWRRVGKLLDQFTAQECANYISNAGYASI